jgi:hypothetical protein
MANAFSGSAARFLDPRPFAWAATVGLGATALLTAVAVFAVARVTSSSDVVVVVFEGDEMMLVGGVRIFLRISPFVSLLTYVTWLVWQYRVNENARAIDPTAVPTSSAWGVLCWFVPFVNFVKPFLVVGEIQCATGSGRRGRWIAWLWWSTWLGSFVVAMVAVVSALVDVFNGVGGPLPRRFVAEISRFTVAAALVTEVLVLVCALLAIALVWNVSGRQYRHVQVHGSPSLAAPALAPPPRPDVG